MDDIEKLMELLETLAEKMPNVVKKVGGSDCGHDNCESDEIPKGYIQVGTLTPESAASRKKKNREIAKDKAEAIACDARAKALFMKSQALNQKWWSDLYRSQSLPADNTYWIGEDGKIWMEPTGKREEKSDE